MRRSELRLDFSQREQLIVAQILIKLAVEEPGDNAFDQRFDGEPWETPRSWLERVPEEGIWEITYKTQKGYRKDLRAKLATTILGWEGIEEVVEEVKVGAGVDLVNELTDAERQVMREKFELFDLDQSGDIDRHELKAVVQELDVALSGLNFDPTDEQMDEIMAHYDADGDGTVNWDEFLEGMSHRVVKLRGVTARIKTNQKEMAKAWQQMVENGTDPADTAAQAHLQSQFNLTNADVLDGELVVTNKKSKRKR